MVPATRAPGGERGGIGARVSQLVDELTPSACGYEGCGGASTPHGGMVGVYAFVRVATASTWCVFGNRSKARSRVSA
jgi:hypothetical protein